MESNFERLEGNLARVTVTVPAEDVDKAIADVYKDAGSKLRVPGFRPGKAPRALVDTQVGREAILAEAEQLIVERSYPKAVDALDLRTMGQPDVGELELPEEGKEYGFSVEVELRPELELSSAEPVTVEVPPAHATEREIDGQLDQMRERFGTVEPVEEPAGPDDFVLLSFTGTVDGEPYEGNEVDKYLYEMGRALMPKEFDESIVGAKSGDQVVAEFVLPETTSNPEWIGKTARFEITVHEVKRKVLPELDDEFAQTAGGFDSLEELREDLRRRTNEQKALIHGQMVEREARRVLGERLTGEIPEQLVDSTNDNMTRDFFNSLEARGITLRDYVSATDVDPEQIQRDIREQAANAVREELALEALFRAKGMEVTEEDVDASLSEFAGEGGDPQKLGERWKEAGILPVVREQVMHRKAVEWLVDNMTVVEKDVPEVGNKETPAAGSGATSGKKKASRKKKDADERAADETPSATGSEE